MAGRAKEAIIPQVRNLITQLTRFHEGEENFDLCERFALSNLWHHRFLSVDSHAVHRTVDGIVTKFEVHGHLDTARKLKELVSLFVNSEVFCDHPQYDIQWSLLSLLLHLSNNPTASAHLYNSTPTSAEVPDQEDDFDWASYLREGDEQFTCVYDESSSEEFSSDIDESPDKGSVTISAAASDTVPPVNLEVEIKVTSKEDIIRNLQDIYAAEKWLESNIMEPYWTSDEAQHKSSSKLSASNLAKLWDRHLIRQGHDIPQTSILREYRVLREILWLLFTPATAYLFKEVNKNFTAKPNVTVPSLSQGTFASYLNHLCPYFKMLQELQSFGAELNCSSEVEKCIKFPPNTFIAYWAVVKEYLNDFNAFVIQIETEVRKQSRTYTLLQLINELEPVLYDLRSMYHIHARAVHGWKTSPNWLSASRLLSVLYAELLDMSKSKQAASMLKMFLKSFEVYLDIIDAWLTHGQLQDCREEFVISRDCGEFREDQEEAYLVLPYETELMNVGIQPLPILQLIVSKLLHASKSVDLLLRLNKLSKTQGCLYENFLEHIVKDLSKLTLRENIHSDVEESLNKEVVKSSDLNSEPNNFFMEIKEHLIRVGDSFLVKAFENYLPFKQVQKDVKQEDVSKNKELLYRSLTQCLRHEMLPLKHVLETNLLRLVEEKWKVASSMVKPIFQHEFSLLVHFQIMRGIFLMEAGDIMHHFYTSLFEQLEMCEASSFSLTILLESCVDQRYPAFSSHFSVVVDNNLHYATSVQEAINSINVRYAVEWPVSLLLSDHNMKYYNTVFQFLLKIKWGLLCLQKLRFSDVGYRKNTAKPFSKRVRDRIHRLECLRFWLLHSVNSIHSYLMGQMLHLLSMELEQNAEQARDLNMLIQAHNAYVQSVYTHCFQSDDSHIIKTSVLKMIWVALRLCEVWEAGVEVVPEARLKELEELYSKCYVFLAIVLSSWTENNTVSNLTSLSAAFDTTRLPKHYPATFTVN